MKLPESVSGAYDLSTTYGNDPFWVGTGLLGPLSYYVSHNPTQRRVFLCQRSLTTQISSLIHHTMVIRTPSHLTRALRLSRTSISLLGLGLFRSRRRT